VFAAFRVSRTQFLEHERPERILVGRGRLCDGPLEVTPERVARLDGRMGLGFHEQVTEERNRMILAASTVAIVAIAAVIIVALVALIYIVPRGGRRRR
jgi:hypothetical protein